MMKRILPLLALLPFAACEDIEAGLEEPPTEAAPVSVAATPAVRTTPVAAPAPAAPRTATVTPAAAPAAAGTLTPPPAADGAVAATPAAAPVVAAPTGALGTTVASLGPTDPGLWLETPLVSAPTQGRIEYQGQTVSVQLRPSGGEPGSGSQISLEAMRALGAPLTGLPEITVFGG